MHKVVTNKRLKTLKKYKTVIRKSDCGCVLMRGGCTLYDMGGSY